ncbi:MAG: c-type cytochrome domain-containing protein [Bdellovibrionota bacterium]
MRSILLFVLASLGIPLYGADVNYEMVRAEIFQPICAECHSQPGASADLDLTQYASLMTSKVVVPFKPEESLLFEKVSSGEMPLIGDALSEAQLALIKDWILAGAPDAPPPAELTLKSVTPASGPVEGGTTVILSGSELGSTTEVYFGEALCADLKVLEATRVQCTTPAQDVDGTVAVRLVADSGEAILPTGFEYRPALGASYRSLYVNIFRVRCLGCHNNENPSHGLSLESYETLMGHRRAVIPFNLKKSRLYKKTREGEMPKNGPPLSRAEVSAIGAWISAGAPNN